MSSSGITYKDIDLLTKKAAVSGNEKIVVSADEFITPEQIAGMVDLSGKVDKIPGMGLSQNDFKDADKIKLDRLENYDDTALKRRMTEAEGDIADIELALPTFITKTVNDLANYYLKSETYTREEVAALIAQIQGMEFVPVQTLPTASADTLGKIYLVPAANPQTANQVDEYYTQDNGSGASPRYTWELFGSAALDLTGYVTTTALNTALASYTTTADLTTLLSGKQDTINDLADIRSGAAAGATAVQPGDLPTVPTAYDLTPSPLGTAAAGASDDWARGDHAHAMPSAADVGAIASPVGGTTGQVLRKTASGAEWDDESVATELQVQDAVDSYLDDHPSITGTFSNTAKRALLALLSKVAYIDDQGQTYLDNLEDALFAVEVDSITAVFTQGVNVVYNTDSLDTLKSMLVVTAEYSDQTTEVLSDSDYTLTGTLTVGTSTITANYGGVTDTFTVTVSAGYVTDGLVAYWDGRDNTGNGHDATAGDWKDIVNGYVFQFQNTSGRQWNADNLELSSGHRGLYGSPKFWTVSENCTIEYVIAPASVRNAVLAMFDPNSSASTMPTGTQAREACLYSDNTVGFTALKDYTYVLPTGLSDLTDIRKLIAVYSNYTVTNARINNVAASLGSAQHSYGQFGPNKFRLAEYADTTQSSTPYYGKIYAVRVYNRALTDAEITQNFNYDNAVYSLGL